MSNPMIECRKLTKSYRDGRTSIEVLKGIDFAVDAGSRISIMGPSGSGKSTLLHLLSGLDCPTSGDILVNGVSWTAMNERAKCRVRNRHLGFIYQFHHLLPEFSALENVAMPLLLNGTSVIDAKAKAKEMLDKVGLCDRLTHQPSQMSGGERQRVAIARALINHPQCIFADEPTGNLDGTTAAKVFELMLELNFEFKTALVIVTHDVNLARKMDRCVVINDGLLS